jgi:hypothetical protein
VRAAALLCVLLLAAPARAEDALWLGATEKLDYRRADRDGQRDEAFRNRLEVSAQQGIFSAWVRLESLQLSDAGRYDPFGAADGPDAGRIDVTEVTRRALTLDRGSFRAVAGDFSSVFGRGLALSVFEDEELNYDTRLEGIRGTVHHDLGTLTALAGSRRGDRFRGAFAETAPLGPVRVGADFVEAWGSADSEILDRERHAGGLAEVTLGPAQVYGEYVLRSFPGRNGRGERGTSGHGGFVSAVATYGSVTVSGEVRDMFRFEHPYNDPPTSLRQHTWSLLNREAGQALQDIPDDDVKGYGAEAEWAPGLFTTFLGSFGRLDADRSDDGFWELYGEGKSTWREIVFVTAAASESEFRFGTQKDERISGFGEVVVQLDAVNSVSLGVEWAEARIVDSLTQDFLRPEDFRERIFSASFGRSPWLQVTATLEDTTEDDPTEPRSRWFNALAEIAVAEGHDVQVSYGAERGGWKCTGGVCFFEPEFEGLKLKWVGRY